MALPKYYEIYTPFLQHLRDEKPHHIKEIRAAVAAYFNLSEDEQAVLLNGGRQTVFHNRIAWASIYLKKSGLIISPSKGTYCITKRGLEALAASCQLDNNYLMQFNEFRDFKQPKCEMPAGMAEDTETLDDIIEQAFDKITQSLQDQLLQEIMKLSPASFEQFVLDLMSRMGYGTFKNAAKTTNYSGDEGIDGIIMEDKLGFSLIYVQAKLWNPEHLVGRPDIQAFVGAIAGKNGRGLFVTTSKFTKHAVEYAHQQHIILIDGNALTRYMIEYNFGCVVKKRFEIKDIDSALFDDYEI